MRSYVSQRHLLLGTEQQHRVYPPAGYYSRAHGAHGGTAIPLDSFGCQAHVCPGARREGYWRGLPPLATGGRPITPEPFSSEILLKAIGTSYYGVCGIEESTATVYCWSQFTWFDPPVVSGVPVP